MLSGSFRGNNKIKEPIKEVLTMFDQYDEILTVADVMELLYVGKNTVYSLLHAGELRAFRIGKTWKIPKACLEEYILKKGISS